MIDAAEAERVGLVNAVFADDIFSQEVARRAQDLALNTSPRANRITKRLTYEACSSSLKDAVRRFHEELPGTLASEDFREGIEHFIEKRPARFTGH